MTVFGTPEGSVTAVADGVSGHAKHVGAVLRFDLDHFGPEIGHDGGGGVARHERAEAEDADTAEQAGTVRQGRSPSTYRAVRP